MLNLSKSGGIDQGSTGDQSDRSENPSPAPSMRDEDDNLSDDNLSEVDERGAKDDGKLPQKSLLIRKAAKNSLCLPTDNCWMPINLVHCKD